MRNVLRVAVVQSGSILFDAEASLTKANRLMAEAADRGAQLAVFPEAFVSAYPKGSLFGAYFGGRSAEGREEFRRYFNSAITLPGPELAKLQEGAKAAHLYAVIGVIERGGGTLYCTAVFIGPDGEYLGKHRKLMPTGAEMMVWGFGDGSTMPAVSTPFGILGAVICWENYMPLMRAAMFAKGVQIYCAPTADDRDTWVATMQHVALEGRCFVLSACQYLKRDAFPEDFVSARPPEKHVIMRGGSLIVNPLGQILAGPYYEGETLLTADLDLDEIARGKYDFDANGHYARPDIFSLRVNENATAPVVFNKRSGEEAT